MRCGLTNSVLFKYQVLLLNVSTSTSTDTVIHGVFLASFNSGHDTLRYYYNKFKNGDTDTDISTKCSPRYGLHAMSMETEN